MKSLIILLSILFSVQVWSQTDTIFFKNPSFEGEPRAGSSTSEPEVADGWIDCSVVLFPGNTPADLHPGGFFNVVKESFDGETYLGMVAREDKSWEAVTQKLTDTLKSDQCYELSLYLARSENYVNREYEHDLKNLRITVNGLEDRKRKKERLRQQNASIKKQDGSLILCLYGGSYPCHGEFLVETSPIEHTDWQEYKLMFQAPYDLNYLTFAVYYKTGDLLPYNGNMLLDHLSPIIEVDCNR